SFHAFSRVFGLSSLPKFHVNKLYSFLRKPSEAYEKATMRYGRNNSLNARLSSTLKSFLRELLREMMKSPFPSYHPNLIHEPTLYRLDEAVMHYGESIKEITNEEFGNGIMSATVFYCSADKVKGGDREDRVVATFDGKQMPWTEQKSELMAASKSTTTSKLTNS
ncbi:hypothetical protein Golob_024529, partial [Gossypium lobatum]|nr:hypothetical protein [Gossypium lobatum]